MKVTSCAEDGRPSGGGSAERPAVTHGANSILNGHLGRRTQSKTRLVPSSRSWQPLDAVDFTLHAGRAPRKREREREREREALDSVSGLMTNL